MLSWFAYEYIKTKNPSKARSNTADQAVCFRERETVWDTHTHHQASNQSTGVDVYSSEGQI
jgi:hypothetical protein